MQIPSGKPAVGLGSMRCGTGGGQYVFLSQCNSSTTVRIFAEAGGGSWEMTSLTTSGFMSTSMVAATRGRRSADVPG
ncbi:hypothetical protein [Nocardia sp. BMG51109]|uniref:hypothetical protein n=1 Tax=Nocardia sp. BMG51109 TaxID=1056816 RepID=UPI0004631D40|nr:hypothetical protein [Nocardia sp. BMG51109]